MNWLRLNKDSGKQIWMKKSWCFRTIRTGWKVKVSNTSMGFVCGCEKIECTSPVGCGIGWVHSGGIICNTLEMRNGFICNTLEMKNVCVSRSNKTKVD